MRHIDTATPVTKVPLFALAKFLLTSESSALLNNPDMEASIAFPTIPLGVIGTDHVGYGSFDLWPFTKRGCICFFESRTVEGGYHLSGAASAKG